MSKEIIFRCNRCGKVIEGDQIYRLNSEIIDKATEEWQGQLFDSRLNQDTDFCLDCIKIITNFALRKPGMTINPDFEKAIQDMIKSDPHKNASSVTEVTPSSTVPEGVEQKLPDPTPVTKEEEKIKRQINEIDMPTENKYPAKKSSNKKLTEEQCIKAEDMYKMGTKVQVIADTLGATYINVYDHLKSCGLKKKTTPRNA